MSAVERLEAALANARAVLQLEDDHSGLDRFAVAFESSKALRDLVMAVTEYQITPTERTRP